MPRLVPTLDAFAAQGFGAQAGFLSEDECSALLEQIASYRSTHELPEVYRASGDRPLHYSVIDGERITTHFPDLVSLYERVNALVNEAMGEELVPLEDLRVGLNVNVTPAGGTYRWHYDRNAVTAILYLNAVPGGETEIYPNYRLFMEGARYSALQRIADRVLEMRIVRGMFGRLVQVAPETGLLVAMRGNRCLHSVRPVEGDADRINVIMAYDRPGVQFAVAPQLDQYLYESEAASKVDPNYR
ncbi:MAG: 2OG-Fe(II) oxygenase [Bacteroidetes bacterium]|nr:2OG-Fe(II) oxygenase [Bacteroidota bacterium]